MRTRINSTVQVIVRGCVMKADSLKLRHGPYDLAMRELYQLFYTRTIDVKLTYLKLLSTVQT
jgi:hypothetical protein